MEHSGTWSQSRATSDWPAFQPSATPSSTCRRPEWTGAVDDAREHQATAGECTRGAFEVQRVHRRVAQAACVAEFAAMIIPDWTLISPSFHCFVLELLAVILHSYGIFPIPCKSRVTLQSLFLPIPTSDSHPCLFYSPPPPPTFSPSTNIVHPVSLPRCTVPNPHHSHPSSSQLFMLSVAVHHVC